MSATALLHEISAELANLRSEIGEKNHVMVHVNRFDPKGKRWHWTPEDVVYNSKTDLTAKDGLDTMALLPMFTMMDKLRLLAGKPALWLPEALRVTGGELVSVTPNLRPTIGIDYTASALGDASGSRAAVAQYIALSNSTGTLDAADTSARTGAAGTGINWGTANATDAAAANSRGEYTALGLARAIATYAHTAAATNYTMTKTFTATSAITAVQVCGLFNSATQGAASSLTSALFVENNFTATTLATNDQLTITWTITI